MIRLLILVVLVGVLAAVIRWLTQYSSRPDGHNSHGTLLGVAHDSTRGAYLRRFKEMVTLRQMRERRDPPPSEAEAQVQVVVEEGEAKPQSRASELGG